MQQPVVPWDIVRKSLDLEYLEGIHDYINQIPTSDLEAYEVYCRQQRLLNTPRNKNQSDWTDLIAFINLELDYRS